MIWFLCEEKKQVKLRWKWYFVLKLLYWKNLKKKEKNTWWLLESHTKCSFFQAAVISILLYGCTMWMLTKRIEKKLDGNYTRMLQAVLNKSWRQHSTKQQLYGHLPPIMKTIQIRWTRHVEHCRRNKDKLVSDVLLWSPSHRGAKVGQLVKTYLQQLCDIQNVAWKSCHERWMIEMGGVRGSEKSVLAAWRDDDDDDDM